MKETKRSGFYLEVILMLAVSIFVIQILSSAFAASYRRSRQASRLSAAVTLAANGAELCASAKSGEELCRLLSGADARLEGDVVTAFFDEDLNMDPAGAMQMRIEWKEDEKEFADIVIDILCNGETVYTLDTGIFTEGDRP